MKPSGTGLVSNYFRKARPVRAYFFFGRTFDFSLVPRPHPLVATLVLPRSRGNTSIELLLDVSHVRLFICLSSSSLCMPWKNTLTATSCLLNSSLQYCGITCSFHIPPPNFQRKAYLKSIDSNLTYRGLLSEV